MKKMVLDTNSADEFEYYRKRCLELEVEVENLKKKNKELEEKLTLHNIPCSFINNNAKKTNIKHIDEEDLDDFPSAKRIRTSNIIRSDDENSNIHNVIIDISDEDVNDDETPENKNISDEEDLDDFSSAKRIRTSNIIRSDDENSNMHNVIDISDDDEDVNYDETSENKNIYYSSNHVAFDKTNIEDVDEEDLDGLEFQCSNGRSAKRKRAANIIPRDDETSDNETTYDDNVLISTFTKPLSSKSKIDSEDEVTECASKRRLTRLRKLSSKNKQDTRGVDQNKTVSLQGNSSSEDEDGNDDVDGYGSESLSDFINDSPEILSESESASESSDNFEEPENVLNDYKETIDNIRRKKVSNYKWDLQGEMQADFGKDPELCMRAVCALYRQQTEDEKASKGTIHHNERGFSQPDAYRGSKVAEFLMDGGSDLNKTVEELEMYDSKGIELCRSFALKYSKQLFEIYQNKEDPYFLP